MIATAIRQIFQAHDGSQASERLAEVVARLAGPAPKVARLLEGQPKSCSLLLGSRATTGPSSGPQTRSSASTKIGRRSEVVGIYPNDRALIRLAGMLLLE